MLPPQKPRALAEGPHGLACLRHPQGLSSAGRAPRSSRGLGDAKQSQRGGLLFLAGHALVDQLNVAFASLFQTAP